MGAQGQQMSAVYAGMAQGLARQAAGNDVRARAAQFLGKGQAQQTHGA